MPIRPHTAHRLLRHGALASACALALLNSQPASADSSVTVGVNLWLGGADADWFNNTNWWYGALFGLPAAHMPVYIGPSQILANGIPTPSFDLPASEAVLQAAFSTPSLDMRAWDGISQIRLAAGALLTANSATVGGLNNAYRASGAIQSATIVLDGGQLAGSWSFLAHSRVLVLGQYTGPLGNWSGTIGELQIGTNGKLTSAGLNASISNLRNDGELLVGPSTTVSLTGTAAINGRIEISGQGQQAAVLQLTGDTTLSGRGETVLVGRNNSFIGNSDNAAKTLTIAAGHTVRGSGMLGGGRYGQYASDGISVVNEGRLVAEGVNGLGSIGPSFENRGQLIITGGSALDVGGAAGLRQTTANALTTVNGVLRASTLVLDAGQLKGSGTVMANVINTGGTISAGNSPGTLNIGGNLTLGDDSLMLVEVAGLAQGIQYDWLQVSGDVVLGGDLRLDFGSYAPQLGEHYSFLTSTGGHISGMFNTAYANGYVLTMDYSMQGVTATVSAITAVPEPSTYGLMLLGLGWLGARLRRRPAQA